ncbi:hypothetical protein CJ030_MR4G007132 [Morella rubra]|uniref:Uncharacterized protein n=1 Tax=Morella rubra TaxID=262757 RepID=A0A6A1VUF7_9ROSI|nr:hypothetical protein CJ030_MR4G007132 [Morella rubra]
MPGQLPNYDPLASPLNKAVVEGTNVTFVLPENTGDTKNASTCEAKDQAEKIEYDNDMGGEIGFVLDTARELLSKQSIQRRLLGTPLRRQWTVLLMSHRRLPKMSKKQ